jgi:hypothetical protein
MLRSIFRLLQHGRDSFEVTPEAPAGDLSPETGEGFNQKLTRALSLMSRPASGENSRVKLA